MLVEWLRESLSEKNERKYGKRASEEKECRPLCCVK
jgi:hypothetical protein